MPRNKITDLRNHLFEEIENLKDCDAKDLEANIKRAKAIANVATVITDSVKLEVEFIKAVKGEQNYQSQFLQAPNE